MLIEAALVGVRHDAGVHQRSGGIAIFLAEVCPDELLPLVANAGVRKVKQLRNLGESAKEHLAGLPVPRFEIGHDVLQLAADFLVAQGEDLVDQPAGAPRVGPIPLPCEVERTDHDSGRIRLQPQRMEFRLNHKAFS